MKNMKNMKRKQNMTAVGCAGLILLLVSGCDECGKAPNASAVAAPGVKSEEKMPDAAEVKKSFGEEIKEEVKEIEEKVKNSIKTDEHKTAEWLTDFKEAQARARKEKKPILIDFSGSDWCGWCMKLDKEVFSQPAFHDWAEQNTILFIADFPRKEKQTDAVKQQNQLLMQTYGVQGFPTIILIDSEGNRIAETGYRSGGAENYTKHLDALLKTQKTK